jgi:hypothetical protein
MVFITCESSADVGTLTFIGNGSQWVGPTPSFRNSLSYFFHIAPSLHNHYFRIYGHLCSASKNPLPKTPTPWTNRSRKYPRTSPNHLLKFAAILQLFLRNITCSQILLVTLINYLGPWSTFGCPCCLLAWFECL